MTRLADPAGRLAFIADFKGQASIGQVWVKTQTKSKPNVGPASSQQTEKKVTLRSSTKTGEAYSYKAVPLRKASATPKSHRRSTGGAVANFIKENIVVRFGVPHKIISDNGTSFINSDARKMLEFYQVKHHCSSSYYPQGSEQAEATNKVLIKIISKMSKEYTGGWATHLPDVLWAYRKSTKSATGFSPFSLVYETEVVNPTEVMTPSLRFMQMQGKEKEEEAQERSHRYKQNMTEAYGRMTKERVFAEGQLVPKVADYVRRGMAGPSKFAPKWKGPLVIRKTHPSGYYRLA
ncbi:uncharacterized protein LOC126691362 [Quercus robur]|uniref:uncharacterized protein LOC126691362 n=1 Tax=Quercus robur TaxID=38942 RepID=UPI0021639B61|nr:uncharacterized protein LOC126691362 [Quercus robur]